MVVAVYLGSILKPVKTPSRHEGTFENLSLHRYLCLTTFFTTLFLLLLHSLPGVLYTVDTYHGPPILHPTATWLGPARTVSLVVTLLVAGCMRRGPRSHFTPLKFGLGFGVFEDEAPAKAAQDGSGKDDAYGDESDESDNVLDYSNSALLDFIFLSYVSFAYWAYGGDFADFGSDGTPGKAIVGCAKATSGGHTPPGGVHPQGR